MYSRGVSGGPLALGLVLAACSDAELPPGRYFVHGTGEDVRLDAPLGIRGVRYGPGGPLCAETWRGCLVGDMALPRTTDDLEVTMLADRRWALVEAPGAHQTYDRVAHRYRSLPVAPEAVCAVDDCGVVRCTAAGGVTRWDGRGSRVWRTCDR